MAMAWFDVAMIDSTMRQKSPRLNPWNSGRARQESVVISWPV